ncbi:MAG: NADH-quinone oxidoreductase subunit L [Armatimonadota bacterium]|nr:NADH-quinone oxidoreductase subunit L [Armatimonadota bacterium]MDR7451478.1 NADH-quinone oxidoreductase subunit L [Armatimonadota bacterium]MDR7467445.1 NADH-quinone oxidoreductase subunit L [Armatimonadota bacterium]MDR7494319.1 NADH-quinone oxidoreductase subunit L [Armatimonadota bacterium]MDR7499136.1 NADH-quinone oxidoreductase subunit L [Armatimonadota bacterium]
MLAYAWLIPLLPFLAFWLIVFFGRALPGQGAYVAIGALVIDAVLSLGVLAQVLGGASYRAGLVWAVLGDRALEVGYQIDPLTAVMLLVVTVVGSLIFVYSVGYMHGDPRYPRFFAYLSLFAASMLTLVLADNLLLLYIGWEGVGLCSYLLIGFWFERPAAARASLKAFVTTRVGDTFMFIGILLLFFTVGTLQFDGIFEAVEAGQLSGSLLILAALLIFGGAVGKSAQLPLHVWLPDAMEGPTPVSALIHAATMVAAGVYLVARSYLLFFGSPDHAALTVVAWVGGLTAFMAATIGIVQDDIKRVLAYSTISQLGYMMLGLGVLGYTAGVFHLMTHAFFKALLFLAAGSVIHAMHTNDMKEMGGLARVMPTTYWTMLIGGLALAGVPPLSGFWSKDEILLEAFHNNRALFVLGEVTAFLTAFYVGRMLFYTFGGTLRSHHAHPHESPAVMTVPLVILAVFAAGIGLVGAPFLGHAFGHFVRFEGGGHGVESGAAFDPAVAGLSTAAALAGLLVAAVVYHWRWVPSTTLRRIGRPLYVLLVRKYYWDEFYQWTVVRPVIWIARRLRVFDLYVIDGAVNAVGIVFVWFARLYRLFDLYVVDGLVNLVGWITGRLGAVLRYVQTGRPQNYLLVIALGVIVLVIGGILR